MTLDELDAAYAAMTPVEWTQWEGHAAVFAGVEENNRGSLSGKHLVEICRCESDDLGEDDEEGEAMAQANAAGIVALHNHYPALRERLRRAEELLSRLRKCKCHKEGCVYHQAAAFLAECGKPLEATS